MLDRHKRLQLFDGSWVTG